MKNLYLIRHAKSSWKDTSLPDFERPLNKRGKGDAPDMGRRLHHRGVQADMLLSSPAVRAKKTAVAVAREIGFPEEKIDFRSGLYHASPLAMQEKIAQVDDKVATLFLVGHNPGLTDLACQLTSAGIDNIVTCGIYAMSLDIKHWADMKLDGKASLIFYDYPKKKQT